MPSKQATADATGCGLSVAAAWHFFAWWSAVCHGPPFAIAASIIVRSFRADALPSRAS